MGFGSCDVIGWDHWFGSCHYVENFFLKKYVERGKSCDLEKIKEGWFNKGWYILGRNMVRVP